MFLEAQVHRATVTSGRFQRRVRSRPRFGKKLEYQGLAIASRREAVTCCVTDLEVEEELRRHFETRSLKLRRATRGTASKNEWSTTLCWCEHGVLAYASAAAALARMSSLNYSIFFLSFFFCFEICQKLSYKGSVERSRHEQHFCSLLPYYLLSCLQIFQLCLSFWTSSFDLVLF